MTLKQRIYSLLLEDQKYRDNDKELVWRIWDDLGYVKTSEGYGCEGMITEEGFFEAPAPKTIYRCRRSLQRTDSLTGEVKLIQPSPKVKKNRVKLSNEHGQSYQEGKLEFDPVKQVMVEV